MVLDKPQFPLRVFYDGACVVCATEVEHYGRKDREGHLRLIDISDPGFDSETHGLNRDEIEREMYVVDDNGSVYRGVEAFWAIWQAYPPGSIYRLLGRLITLPGVNVLARFAYRVFARYRHLLPKRRRSCPDDSCQLPPEKRD